MEQAQWRYRWEGPWRADTMARFSLPLMLNGRTNRLGIGSRTELATRALREGWLDVPAERER